MKAGKTKTMAYIALMTVILVVSAWITVPMGIPLTLQTYGVFSALLILGGKYGTVSIFLYILIGVIGVPVFSGFSGGVGVIMGPTGGYILGFLLMGIVYWLITVPVERAEKRLAEDLKNREKLKNSEENWEDRIFAEAKKVSRGKFIRILALLAGLVVCYAFGTFWFMFVYAASEKAAALNTAVAVCVLPYILPDLVKLVLAYVLCDRFLKIMKRAGEIARQ